MTLTVGELIEILSEFDESMRVRIAYQPNYPLYAGVSHVKVMNDKAYICMGCYSGDVGYAPRVLFEDSESGIIDTDDDEEGDYYE